MAQNNKEHEMTENFRIGLELLEYYEKKVDEGVNITVNQRAVDEIKLTLWGHMLYWARSEIKKGMDRYRKSSDYFDELESDCCAIFFEKLKGYDPALGAPTTYFTPYFRQVITVYRHANSQNLSANDAKNIGAIRAAIGEHEKKGEDYTVNILALDTGLSIKVVKNSLFRMQTSVRANIDDCRDLSSKIPGPEELAVKNEINSRLYDALQNVLTDDEIKFLFYKVDIFGSGRERSYKEVAEHYNTSAHEVKSLYSDIKLRLARDAALSSYFTSQRLDDMQVKIHTSASDDMERDILNALDNATTDI